MKKYLFLSVWMILFLILQSCKTLKTVKSESTEEAMLKALRWQEANPIQAQSPVDWTNGAYYVGVVKAHETTANKAYLASLKSMAERNQWQTGSRFYHADDLIISYSYLYLKSIGETNVNMQPTDLFIKDHLNKQHSWREGTLKNEKSILWWWCDALFMAPPVLTLYAQQTNNLVYLTEMDKYFMQSYDLLYDKKEKLFARDGRFLWTGTATDIKEDNGNKVFWSRGNGWVLAGLALLLTDMPKNYIKRPFYENLYKEMALRIKNLQPDDGLWRTSLLSPESFKHGEVSGSGFFTYALAWGVNNGLLDKTSYQPAIEKAWNAILKCQHPNGKVGWVQNIGFDPKPADADSWQNFGTGAFLMAGSEVLKLK